MLSCLGKQTIYYNKYLRDYTLRATTTLINKITTTNRPNNINLDCLTNLTNNESHNKFVFFPFLFYSIYFSFLYSNKKN